MADWGLQAVIRPNEYDDIDEGHGFRHLVQDELFAGSIDIKKEYYDQSLLFSFPHLVGDQQHHDHDHDHDHETLVVTDELNQLYKPFYQLPDIQTNNIHHHFDQQIQQNKEEEVKNFGGSAPKASQVTPKHKKRKNQQKRVVVQVTADGLSSDPWAWRKYGQKPIKGSIYPRSYYRCSTLKGCMARRQVEQSCTDSSIYILTYTAEHNHPKPTRRNSLAGINRGRLKATPKSPTTSEGCKTVTISKDSPFHSPTPLSAYSSIEDEGLQQSNIKHETTFDHNMMLGINDDDGYMLFNDDFFEGLEDFGGYKLESSSNYVLC